MSERTALVHKVTIIYILCYVPRLPPIIMYTARQAPGAALQRGEGMAGLLPKGGLLADSSLGQATVDEPDSNGWTPLLTACVNGDSSCVQLLLIAHAALDRPTNEGRTPLHAACNEGHSDCVKLLLAARAAVDRPDSWGGTPLHIACGLGHGDMVLLLLAAHAAADRPTNKGRTPLYIASHQGHSNCVRLLHAARATVDRPEDSHGWTPLFAACLQGHGDCAQLLLAARAAADRPTRNGTTPLCTASHQGHRHCVQQLLAAHAAVDRPNRDGTTPLYAACDQGHGDCVQLLLAAHAAVDQPTDAGTTPLHAACQIGSLHIVKRLVHAGAMPELVFSDGRMPPMLKGLLRPWRDTLLSQSERPDNRAQRDTQRKECRQETTKAHSAESALKKILDSNEAQMGASMEARRVELAKEAAAVEQHCRDYESMVAAWNSSEYANEVREAMAALKAEREAKAQAKAEAEAAAAAAAAAAAPSPARAPSGAWGLWGSALDLANDASVDESVQRQRGHTTVAGFAPIEEELITGSRLVALSPSRRDEALKARRDVIYK